LRADIVRVQGVEEAARFRFSDARFSGVDSGDRGSVISSRVDSGSCRTQPSTRDKFAAVVESDNGGVAAMMVELCCGCQPAAVGGCGTGHSTAAGARSS
jgi:hypothetical protein